MSGPVRAVLGLLILFGAFARGWQLDWGQDPYRGVFCALHPDERTLVQASSELRDSLEPGVTSYGTVGLYLPWVVGVPLAQVVGVPLFDLADDHSRRFTYLVVRGVSAVAAIGAIALAFALGRRLAGPLAGLLGAAFLAVSVLPIQQAHFYTVDGIYTAATLAGLWLATTLTDGRRWLAWLGFGAVAGAAAAVRISGLALLSLGGVAALLGRPGPSAAPADRGAAAARQAGAGAAALATLVALQPYMVLDPGHYFGPGGWGSLRTAIAIADGGIPRIFTLFDAAQTPFLFHLRSLLLHAVGPALQVVGLAGLGWLAWRRRPDGIVALSWFVVQLLLVGGLEAKNARYLLPLVPVLCVAAAGLLAAGLEHPARTWRRLSLVVTAATLLTTTLYAVAYLRVYARPNNRIEAAAALPQLFPDGAAIGYEGTGVAMDELLPPGAFDLRSDPIGVVFNLDAFMLHADRVLVYVDWLHGLDGLALVDVARLRHFAAVAGRYPVEAELYRRLYAGDLAFDVIAEFAHGPGLGPWAVDDRRSDPSFYGYDHPRVTLLRSRAGAGDELRQTGSAWVRRVREDADGLDAQVLRAARLLVAGDFDGARRALDGAAAGWPDHRLPVLLRCELLLRQGNPEAADGLWRGFVDGLGLGQGQGIWEHEILGLEYAGRTLRRLGAEAVGQRCLDLAARLR